ncbi:MAG: hypothetical protein COU85_02610 [Candidatus Portnoybacteria bacterium CG10_big_fil_rev_8_21_14_0_10_44_7]|uniref:Uncharacterized protein n=1 Tax=Candidatus Portnoybacteria bacterium CG10_big_fil_rev_8_21_14_0_10_44_7 TaxID=1974816 RepID=A0A2M8KIA1_9BACT|nr:MAG: hypothetical protein COU85_02610 [Candidatus Portnoybacteria bacterium CG10_big_fil_rev_8_21_14_0_10_44_7]
MTAQKIFATLLAKAQKDRKKNVATIKNVLLDALINGNERLGCGCAAWQKAARDKREVVPKLGIKSSALPLDPEMPPEMLREHLRGNIVCGYCAAGYREYAIVFSGRGLEGLTDRWAEKRALLLANKTFFLLDQEIYRLTCRLIERRQERVSQR